MPSRENLYMLSVMYKHKRITVGVGMGNPFVDNYKRINETWNFPFGRNYQSGGKKIFLLFRQYFVYLQPIMAYEQLPQSPG